MAIVDGRQRIGAVGGAGVNRPSGDRQAGLEA
jgi:hypothetical protein